MAYVSSEELCKNFDVIVYGTGLTESIIAAALSRNGVSVLHLDANQFYGGESASLMYREFMDFLEAAPTPTDAKSTEPSKEQTCDKRYFLRSSLSRIYENIEQQFVEQPSLPVDTQTGLHTNVLAGAELDSSVTEDVGSKATKESQVTSSQLTEDLPYTVSSNQTPNNELKDFNSEIESPSSLTSSTTQSNSIDTTAPTELNTTAPSDLVPAVPSELDTTAPTVLDTTAPTELVPAVPSELDTTAPTVLDTIAPTELNTTAPTELNTTAPTVLVPAVQSEGTPSQDKESKTPDLSHLATKPADGPVLSWTELKSQYRMFTFDLWPKLIYATDPFVDMIVKSTITKYLEFKAVNKIITVLDRNLTLVPASRADVFTSKSVSVLEKRLLMRFVTYVMELDKHEEELEQFKSRPFSEFMDHKNLSNKLKSLITSSIAQVEEDSLTGVALERSKFYLQSIGRYGNSPYLWPVYGLGELPQAFCRMSAVFGGCYMLRKEIQYLDLIQTEGVTKCTSVCDAENIVFNCNHLILGASLVPDLRPTARYSRAILATNRKLSLPNNPDIKSDVGFITVPSYTLGADQPHTIKVIELSPNSQSSADRCYLVHLTCLSSESTAREDLLPGVEFLFHNTADATDQPPKPKVLYSIYFNYNGTQSPAADKFQLADNVHLISSPDLEPSYQQILTEAQNVFNRICPGESFLPPPPDPEDIIYEPSTTEPTEPDGGAVQDSPHTPADGIESTDQTEQ